MGMTPEQFFEAFVRGNYDDYVQHPGCIRKAFNAAVSAYHLADHYWAYYKRHDRSRIKTFKDKDGYLEFLENSIGHSFRDIQSIATVYKHLFTSSCRKKAVDSSISSTGAVESISLADKNAEVRSFEQECVGDPGENEFKLTVIYTRKDGQRIEFLPYITHCCRILRFPSE